MAQNNNDLEDGFDGMEATNDIVEASKAKNNTEKEFEPDPPNQFFVECQLEEHGESKRRVEDDQQSQVSKSAHLMEVETGEDCNGENSNSVHGLDSWVEDTTGPYLVTHQGQENGSKTHDNNQSLANPATIEHVQDSERV